MKESTIQIAVIEYLSLVSRPFNFMFFSVPNEGLMTVLKAFNVPKITCHKIVNFFKKMGLTPGVADIEIVKDGQCYFIEMKNPDGEQSEEQKIFQENCIRTGAPYAICRSVQDVQVQLKEWGVIL